MTQSLNHPQLGFVLKETLTVPATGRVALPRPVFPTSASSPYAHTALLYQFDGDNAQDLELVVSDTDTVGTTIPSGVAWEYGGDGIAMDALGYYRYLYNATGAPVTVTTTLTRVR